VSRPLRILQVTDLYDPFIGGMESHVKALSHGLVRLGHEVTVATARLPGTAAWLGAQTLGAIAGLQAFWQIRTAVTI